MPSPRGCGTSSSSPGRPTQVRPGRGKGRGRPDRLPGKRGLDTVPSPSPSTHPPGLFNLYQIVLAKVDQALHMQTPTDPAQKNARLCQEILRGPVMPGSQARAGPTLRSVGGCGPGQEDHLLVCERGPTDRLWPRPGDLWPLPASVPWLVPPAVARGVRGWGGRICTCFLESLEEAGEGSIPRTEHVDEVCPCVSVRTRGSLPCERFNPHSPHAGGRALTHPSEPRQLTL